MAYNRINMFPDYKIGSIFFLKGYNLVQTESKHPYILFAVSENDFFFICGTSQFEKRASYFKYNKIDPSTLVRIKKNDENKLTKDETFFDCNSFSINSKNELFDNVKHKKAFYCGEIKYSEIEQIWLGIIQSKTIEKYIKDIVSKYMKEDNII